MKLLIISLSLLLEHDTDNLTLEGLTDRRTQMEKNNKLETIFDRLHLKNYILSDKPTLPSNTHWKGTMVESIIGAIYLDGGISAVKRFLAGWKPHFFVTMLDIAQNE